MKNVNLSHYSKLFLNQLKLITIIIFALSIINIIIPVFPYYDYRNGINSQQLFFSHPTYLANTCILMNIIIFSLSKNKASEIKYLIMLTIVTILTMRGKAIGFIFAYYILIYLLIIRKVKLKKRQIITIGILVTIICWGRIKEQIIENENYPRSRLYNNSINIAKDYFPVGTGFGTFGSYVSGKYYSPVYYKYGMENTHGINPTDYGAVSDTFWPMILGQFGAIGFFVYLGIIMVIINEINKYRKNNVMYYMGAISPILYLILASISESSFTNYYSIEFIFISAIFTNMLIRNNIIDDKRESN